MSDDTKQSLANGCVVIGALLLLGAFFDQLKDLPAWSDLLKPHVLGEFGSRYIGAAVAIVGAYFKTRSEDSILNKFAKAVPVILVAAALGVSLASCAKARQVAIAADQSYAAAVFALDDAEYQAWQAHVLSDAQHAKLNPPIKKALADVKAVTLAIKAAPASGQIPMSLPDLLKDLNDVQAVIVQLQPVIPSIADKAVAANTKAIALLTQLAGGK